MIKVDKKMLDEFLDLMDDLGEFAFGTKKEIKNQLQTCLNFQGYWSGCEYRIYYKNNHYVVESRF